MTGVFGSMTLKLAKRDELSLLGEKQGAKRKEKR